MGGVEEVVVSELGLRYFLSHPGQLSFSMSRPAWLLLLVPCALFLWLARSRGERLAALFRAAAVAALALAIGGAALTTSLPAEGMTVIAAVDLSESIDATGQEWSLRFVNQIASALAPGDELGVVTFADDARVARPPSAPGDLPELTFPTSRTASDLQRGIETALALLPPGRAHRIVLLSDGNETRGSARSELARLRNAKAAVFAAAPPRSSVVDVSVDKVTVPSLVADGSVFPVRVVVRNTAAARKAILTMTLDGQILGREALELGQGLSAVEIPYRWTGPGSHRLRVALAAEGDEVHGNDYRETTLMVAGSPRVLLLTARPHSPIAAALAAKDFTVDTQTPAQLSASPDELLSYNCIIAENVVAGDLTPAAMTALQRYVRDFGAGFVLAGGRLTYGDAGFKKTPLEAMLPVTLEPRRPPPKEREPIALMLLIDRSNSMGYSSTPQGSTVPTRDPATSKLHYAKSAALALVRQLKDQDYVGLIVFDSLAYEVSPLLHLSENRARLEETIPLLVENGGTDFYDGLESAIRQLQQLNVATKHVILLTDGDTNRNAADHYPLIDQLEKAHISVTTIRIGDDVVNLTLLNDISSRTGGRFYHIANVEMLPQLLLKDATAAMAQAPVESTTEIRPQMASASQLLRGIKPEFPLLNDYAYSRPRRGADVPLFVAGKEEREPLLAAWQYGLGRVAAFTADPWQDAETWVAWESYTKFWSQIARWVMRGQTPWDYVVEAQRREGKSKLLVRAFDSGVEGNLIARVHVDDEHTEDLTLVPVAPRQFEADLPAAIGGRNYPVTLLSRRENQDVTQRTEMVPIPARDEEPQEEFQSTRPNTVLLQQLAEESGGRLNPTVREIAARETGERLLEYPLEVFLLPLAMLLFLGDVAVRRLWLRRAM